MGPLIGQSPQRLQNSVSVVRSSAYKKATARERFSAKSSSGMSNPRKYDDKIAYLKKMEEEEKAAFTQIIEETRAICKLSKGSRMSSNKSIDIGQALRCLEEMQQEGGHQSRSDKCVAKDGNSQDHSPNRRQPFPTNWSPYGYKQLPLPSETNWRRVCSDSQIHARTLGISQQQQKPSPANDHHVLSSNDALKRGNDVWNKYVAGTDGSESIRGQQRSHYVPGISINYPSPSIDSGINIPVYKDDLQFESSYQGAAQGGGHIGPVRTSRHSSPIGRPRRVPGPTPLDLYESSPPHSAIIHGMSPESRRFSLSACSNPSSSAYFQPNPYQQYYYHGSGQFQFAQPQCRNNPAGRSSNGKIADGNMDCLDFQNRARIHSIDNIRDYEYNGDYRYRSSGNELLRSKSNKSSARTGLNPYRLRRFQTQGSADDNLRPFNSCPVMIPDMLTQTKQKSRQDGLRYSSGINLKGSTALSQYRSSPEYPPQSPTSPLSQHSSYSPSESPGLSNCTMSSSPFSEFYGLYQPPQQHQHQQNMAQTQQQFEQFQMIKDSSHGNNANLCDMMMQQQSQQDGSRFQFQYGSMPSSSSSGGTYYLSNSKPQLDVYYDQYAMQQKHKTTLGPCQQQQPLENNQASVVATMPQTRDNLLNTSGKIPDIILTGVDDRLNPDEFSKEMMDDYLFCNSVDPFDSKFFPFEDAFGLDPLKLDELQMLSDPNFVTDQATENSFRQDKQ